MKIDMVLHYIQGRGGTEKAVKLVVNELVARGHTVRLFMTCKPRYTDFEEGLAIKVNTYALYYNHPFDNSIEMLMLGYKLILENTYIPDIIMPTGSPDTMIICHEAVTRMKLEHMPKFAAWMHWSSSSLGDKLRYYKHMDGVLTLTSAMTDTVKDKLPNMPVATIGDPFSEEEILIGDNYRDLPFNKYNLFMVSRISAEKNIDMAFNVTNLSNKYTLNIYGKCGDNENDKYILSKLADNYPNVIWNDWVDDPMDHHIKKYGERGILLLPSLDESFGYVILEAISRGCLVLSTPMEGPQELIDPYNGMLFTTTSDLMRKLDRIDINNYTFDTIKRNVYKYETSIVIDKMLKFIEEL